MATSRTKEEDALRVVVHRRANEVIDDLLQIDGVVGASWDGETDGCPALEIRRDPRVFPAWRLDEEGGRAELYDLRFRSVVLADRGSPFGVTFPLE